MYMNAAALAESQLLGGLLCRYSDNCRVFFFWPPREQQNTKRECMPLLCSTADSAPVVSPRHPSRLP